MTAATANRTPDYTWHEAANKANTIRYFWAAWLSDDKVSLHRERVGFANSGPIRNPKWKNIFVLRKMNGYMRFFYKEGQMLLEAGYPQAVTRTLKRAPRMLEYTDEQWGIKDEDTLYRAMWPALADYPSSIDSHRGEKIPLAFRRATPAEFVRTHWGSKHGAVESLTAQALQSTSLKPLIAAMCIPRAGTETHIEEAFKQTFWTDEFMSIHYLRQFTPNRALDLISSGWPVAIDGLPFKTQLIDWDMLFEDPNTCIADAIMPQLNITNNNSASGTVWTTSSSTWSAGTLGTSSWV